MLFDSFKEEMEYKYGYDISVETSEDEFGESEKESERERSNCEFCDFKGKTVGGLKSHVTKMHREKGKLKK
jgi:hypothetical protein